MSGGTGDKVRGAFAGIAVLVSGLLLAAPAFGATKNLDHSDSNLSWSNPSLWNTGSGPAPVTGDDVVMQPGGEDTTIYDLGPLVLLHSITLHNHATDQWRVFTQVGSPQIGLQSGATVTDDNSLSSPDTFSVGFALNGSTSFTLASTGLALHLDGGIVGTGPVTLTNPGPNDGLELGAVNTYTGDTTVTNSNHRVLFNVNGAVPTGSALTANGVVRFAQSSTIGSLAGGSTVLVASGTTLTVGGDNSNTNFGGSLSFIGATSDAALTKVGNGQFTLSGIGTNSYTGTTTVNGGTLNLTGTIDSPVTVNTGATFSGTGTTGSSIPTPAAVLANSGGAILPGAGGVGTLHIGNLTMVSGSSYLPALGGSGASSLDVVGTVALGSSSLSPSLLTGYTHTPGAVHTIISNDGSDAVTGTFAGLPSGSAVTIGGLAFRISYTGGDGNDVTLTVPQNPTAAITTPASNPTFTQNQVVNSSFSCTEGTGGTGIASCLDQDGHPSGSPLDTSTLGPHTLSVTATSNDTQIGTASAGYTVVGAAPPTPPGPGPTSEDPRCEHLRQKLKRQKRGLAHAKTDNKRAFIRRNIGITERRLVNDGCTVA